jgi:hypothetical protein
MTCSPLAIQSTTPAFNEAQKSPPMQSHEAGKCTMKTFCEIALCAASAWALIIPMSALAESHVSPCARAPMHDDLLLRATGQALESLKARAPIVDLRVQGGVAAQELYQALQTCLKSHGVTLSALSVRHGGPVSDGSPGGHVHTVEYVLDPKPSMTVTVGEEAGGALYVGAEEPTLDAIANAVVRLWVVRSGAAPIMTPALARP